MAFIVLPYMVNVTILIDAITRTKNNNHNKIKEYKNHYC